MLVFNIYVNLLIKYDVSFLVCYDERLSNVVLESGLIGYLRVQVRCKFTIKTAANIAMHSNSPNPFFASTSGSPAATETNFEINSMETTEQTIPAPEKTTRIFCIFLMLIKHSTESRKTITPITAIPIYENKASFSAEKVCAEITEPVIFIRKSRAPFVNRV